MTLAEILDRQGVTFHLVAAISTDPGQVSLHVARENAYASERVMTLRQKSIYHWSMQWYPKQIGVQFRPSENVHRGVWPQKHIAVLDDWRAMPFIRVVIDTNSGSRQIG